MNAARADSDIPAVPALITFEPQTRDIVLGAIKLVHKRLKNKGSSTPRSNIRTCCATPPPCWPSSKDSRATRISPAS